MYNFAAYFFQLTKSLFVVMHMGDCVSFFFVYSYVDQHVARCIVNMR